MTIAKMMTTGRDTSEEIAVDTVIVFSAPLVVNPNKDLNIQKKLLLTRNANIAPEAIARPMTIGLTATTPNTGAIIPAAAMAATETEPIARCNKAATNHARTTIATVGIFSLA